MVKNTETHQPSLSRDPHLQQFLGFKAEEIAAQDDADQDRANRRASERIAREEKITRKRRMAARIGAGVAASALTLAGANGFIDEAGDAQKQAEYDQENKEKNIANNPELFGAEDPSSVTIEVKGGDTAEESLVEVRKGAPKGGPELGSTEAGQDN